MGETSDLEAAVCLALTVCDPVSSHGVPSVSRTQILLQLRVELWWSL